MTDWKVIEVEASHEARSMASLLDLDPDLGLGLDPEEVRSARIRLAVPLEIHPPGPWDPETIDESRRGPFGILVVEGLLARDLSVAGGTSLELLGPTDVVNPWGTGDPVMLAQTASWSVIEATRIALLEPRLTRALAAWPPVLDAVARRAGCRAERLAVQRAISQLPRVEQRLLTLFWYTAERWGRVNSAGVSVTLPLSHAGLGKLVGARRPTVSLALKELADQDRVRRNDDGTWQLQGRPPESVAGIRRAERERVVSARPLGVEPPRLQLLADRIVALRGRYERNLHVAADVMARSQAIREGRRSRSPRAARPT